MGLLPPNSYVSAAVLCVSGGVGSGEAQGRGNSFNANGMPSKSSLAFQRIF